ncbi:hypothetical protein BJ742DRAFT_538271 [Cladochytrium replicatum]|nr:hypothetical protein BJ742DRAFT_538271 [Cladochytrium replicatum]
MPSVWTLMYVAYWKRFCFPAFLRFTFHDPSVDPHSLPPIEPLSHPADPEVPLPSPSLSTPASPAGSARKRTVTFEQTVNVPDLSLDAAPEAPGVQTVPEEDETNTKETHTDQPTVSEDAAAAASASSPLSLSPTGETNPAELLLTGQRIVYDLHVAMMDRPGETRDLVLRNPDFFNRIRACCNLMDEDAWADFEALLYEPRKNLDDLAWIREINQRIESAPALLAQLKHLVGYDHYDSAEEDEPPNYFPDDDDHHDPGYHGYRNHEDDGDDDDDDDGPAYPSAVGPVDLEAMARDGSVDIQVLILVATTVDDNPSLPNGGSSSLSSTTNNVPSLSPNQLTTDHLEARWNQHFLTLRHHHRDILEHLPLDYPSFFNHIRQSLTRISSAYPPSGPSRGPSTLIPPLSPYLGTSFSLPVPSTDSILLTPSASGASTPQQRTQQQGDNATASSSVFAEFGSSVSSSVGGGSGGAALSTPDAWMFTSGEYERFKNIFQSDPRAVTDEEWLDEIHRVLGATIETEDGSIQTLIDQFREIVAYELDLEDEDFGPALQHQHDVSPSTGLRGHFRVLGNQEHLRRRGVLHIDADNHEHDDDVNNHPPSSQPGRGVDVRDRDDDNQIDLEALDPALVAAVRAHVARTAGNAPSHVVYDRIRAITALPRSAMNDDEWSGLLFGRYLSTLHARRKLRAALGVMRKDSDDGATSDDEVYTGAYTPTVAETRFEDWASKNSAVIEAVKAEMLGRARKAPKFLADASTKLDEHLSKLFEDDSGSNNTQQQSNPGWFLRRLEGLCEGAGVDIVAPNGAYASLLVSLGAKPIAKEYELPAPPHSEPLHEETHDEHEDVHQSTGATITRGVVTPTSPQTAVQTPLSSIRRQLSEARALDVLHAYTAIRRAVGDDTIFGRILHGYIDLRERELRDGYTREPVSFRDALEVVVEEVVGGESEVAKRVWAVWDPRWDGGLRGGVWGGVAVAGVGSSLPTPGVGVGTGEVV